MLKFIDNYPLKNLTTLQIGGPAKKFTAVKTQEELIEAIGYAQDNNLNYLVIGSGSNLLVSDEEVDSLVIKNGIIGIKTSLHLEGVIVKVTSGTPLQKLVDYTITYGLTGLQKLTGIPGTVGGAVYGNAGAYGQSISDHIVEVLVISSSSLRGGSNDDRRGLLRKASNLPSSSVDEGGRFLTTFGMTKKECCFAYRNSIFKKTHDIILEVTFQLEPGNQPALQQEAQEIIAKRLVKYPVGIKCPGSFFKNILVSNLPKDTLSKIPQDKIVYGKIPAGALLEEVGANGQSIDGITIASYHANLFINQGNGSAQAFYDLAKKYAQKVKEKFNITLEPEVQLINLSPLI